MTKTVITITDAKSMADLYAHFRILADHILNTFIDNNLPPETTIDDLVSKIGAEGLNKALYHSNPDYGTHSAEVITLGE